MRGTPDPTVVWIGIKPTINHLHIFKKPILGFFVIIISTFMKLLGNKVKLVFNKVSNQTETIF